MTPIDRLRQRRPISDDDLERMACHQLKQLINKGIEVERCKAVWYRRWRLEYPWYKSANGLKKEE